MKKLLLLLFISLGLIGCSSTALEQIDFGSESYTAPLQVDVGSESYDWKKWDCYDYTYGGGEYLLSVGYIPEISDSRGLLLLKDSESPIDTVHSLRGVQHFWEWDSYTIVIKSDGTGVFYDNGFPSEMYGCTYTAEQDTKGLTIIDNQYSRLKSSYIGLIAARVKDEWRYQGAEDNWGCNVHIIQSEVGDVLAVNIQNCTIDNSDKAISFKNSIERAVYKASPLPHAPDKDLFNSEILFYFRVN